MQNKEILLKIAELLQDAIIESEKLSNEFEDSYHTGLVQNQLYKIESIKNIIQEGDWDEMIDNPLDRDYSNLYGNIYDYEH